MHKKFRNCRSRNSNVCLSVFEGLAKALDEMRISIEPKVVVATNFNPKLRFFSGRLFLNATSPIHFYFNNDSGKSYLER
ncbi:LOW QUALITY PROTEIN: hypothetical protein HID58_029145 [Brassica napus]|uniref:Uncharacterized protein n=1 Tax=Brassica napus TaxID=3708 RepID=A0ABQ8CC96_BRANA|nr:LOW QUALITY PROTEIN: hypothetical protein HID58_029145 [Brassica napus]